MQALYQPSLVGLVLRDFVPEVGRQICTKMYYFDAKKLLSTSSMYVESNSNHEVKLKCTIEAVVMLYVQ